MPKKVLRLTVHLKIQAVTCPGVFLPEKNDVYVSVCMLGRFQKTKFVPSVFPLTFNEKVKIEKNFPEAMNPGDVADILEMDTTKFELIQLTPPVGETLAVYEQNTREFLYPGRKLTPSYPGMDRELLMKRSVDFPGIAPRLEFSTTSIIKECPYDLRQIESEEDNVTLELQSSPLRKSMTQLSKRKPSPCPREFSKDNSYKQPTIASQTRSLSPYTKRRMAALSEDANQRLAHLNLGPYQFKKETDSKPPFVIRHVDHKLLPPDDLYIASSSLTSKPSSQKNSPLGSWIYNDPSLRGSYGPSRTSLNMIKKPREKDLQDNSFEDTDELIMSEPAGRQLSPTTTSMNYLTTSSFQKQSPVLNRLSLRERFYPGSFGPTKWEEIHQRVLKVLKSNSARQRLDFNSSAEVDYPSGVRSVSSVNSSCDNTGHLSSVLHQNASVHLGDGDYWSNRAAAYKGKPHRAIFEESLEKIYRNMYKKASDST
ncbi:spermatogenesis-associated protein 6 isoform X2 [Chiloscyllium plagiosum]|uniref:spermatogenesis-associated protein 6 isoform X2 n=1 Tax=Chiloscyllium plagiosum TaxID=36176 RepID=UPI001CB7CD90|nr:spermatogenesis-associated protein 6 isoform X2 [Chiloscyllium plagiosum]